MVFLLNQNKPQETDSPASENFFQKWFSVPWVNKLDAKTATPDPSKIIRKDAIPEMIQRGQQVWLTPADTMRKALSEWYEIEWWTDYIANKQKAKMQEVENIQEDKWFLEKAWDIFSERAWNVWKAMGRDQTWLETWLQTAGNIIGWIWDLALAWVWEVAQAVTPDFIENAIIWGWKKAFDAFANTSVGKAGLEALQWWLETYQQRADVNPRASANLWAIVDVASILPVWKWLTAGKTLATSATKNLAKTEIGKLAVKGWEKIIAWGKKTLSNTADLAKNVVKEWVNRVSWLSDEARDFAYKNPKLLSQAQKWEIDVPKLLSDVTKNIANKTKALSDSGKEYNVIKQIKDKFKTENIDNIISDTLEKFWIKSSKTWIDFSSSSIVSDTWEKSIKRAIDMLSKTSKWATPWELLNTRWKLQEIINWLPFWSAERSAVSQLRKGLNADLKKVIPWLKELDESFAPAIKELKDLKKIMFNKDWSLKQNADSIIKNLTSPANRQKLEKLWALDPELSKKIDAIKYSQAIESSMKNQTWQYVRAWLAWAWLATVAWASTWWVGALVIFALTNPKVITSVLKKAWELAPEAKKIFNKLKAGKWKVSKNEITKLYDKLTDKQKALVLWAMSAKESAKE